MNRDAYAAPVSSLAWRIQTEELWFRPEVEEQTDFEVRRPEIAVHLARRRLVEHLATPGLDDNYVVYNHVETHSSELLTFVYHANCRLARDTMPSGQ